MESTLTVGQLREALVREFRGDFGSEGLGKDLQWFMEHFMKLRDVRKGKLTFADLFVREVEVSDKSYMIYPSEHDDAGKIIEKLNFVVCMEYCCVQSGITSESFPMRPREYGPKTIRIFTIKRPMSSEEVITRALSLGFVSPLYEDAFLFGLEHRAAVDPLKRLVFLHEPRKDPDDGILKVLSWFNSGDGWDEESFSLSQEPQSEGWREGTMFAFIKLPAKRLSHQE